MTTMKKRSSDNSAIYLPGFLLLVLLVALFLRRSKTKTPLTKMSIINKDAEALYFLLIEKGFNYQQARFIVAQSGHETGNFKSKIFKENNNYFGMKLALVRKTTAIGENLGHAKYIDLESCVEDFAIYYKVFKYLPVYPSIQAYVKALKEKGYFEADEAAYLLGCIHFYKLYWEQSNVV